MHLARLTQRVGGGRERGVRVERGCDIGGGEGRGWDGSGEGNGVDAETAGGRAIEGERDNAITTSSEMLQLISFVYVSVGRGGLRGVM